MTPEEFAYIRASAIEVRNGLYEQGDDEAGDAIDRVYIALHDAVRHGRKTDAENKAAELKRQTRLHVHKLVNEPECIL